MVVFRLIILQSKPDLAGYLLLAQHDVEVKDVVEHVLHITLEYRIVLAMQLFRVVLCLRNTVRLGQLLVRLVNLAHDKFHNSLLACECNIRQFCANTQQQILDIGLPNNLILAILLDLPLPLLSKGIRFRLLLAFKLFLCQGLDYFAAAFGLVIYGVEFPDKVLDQLHHIFLVLYY